MFSNNAELNELKRRKDRLTREKKETVDFLDTNKEEVKKNEKGNQGS